MRGALIVYYEYVAIFYHCCYVDIANQLRQLLRIAIAVGLCELVQPISIMRRNSSFKRLLLLWYFNARFESKFIKFILDENANREIEFTRT